MFDIAGLRGADLSKPTWNPRSVCRSRELGLDGPGGPPAMRLY